MRFITLLAVLAITLFAGCTSIPMASTDEDTRAKNFTASPDKARIYVYRDQSFGFAFPMTLTLARRERARTLGQTYVMWEVAPGSYEITSYAEDTSTLTLDTEPGKAYYVRQEVRIGVWKARSQLQQVDEATGRRGVAECRLAQS